MSEIIFSLEEYNKLTSIMKRAYAKKEGIKVKINDELIEFDNVKNYLSDIDKVDSPSLLNNNNKDNNNNNNKSELKSKRPLKLQKKVVINEIENKIHNLSELIVDPAMINISKECVLVKYDKIDQIQLLQGIGKIHIKEGNVLNDVNGDNLLIHCVSGDLRMSQGFAVAVNERLNPDIIRNSLKGYTLDKGDLVIIKQKNINVGYLITKSHYYSKPTNESFTNAIKSLNYYLRLIPNQQIVCPRIGSGLDGLSEEYVEKTLTNHLGDKVTIYDLKLDQTYNYFPKQKEIKQSKVEAPKSNILKPKVTRCYFAKLEQNKLYPTSELRTGKEMIIIENEKCDACLNKYKAFINQFKLNNLIQSDSKEIDLGDTTFYNFQILPKPLTNGICDECYSFHLSQTTESASIKLIFDTDVKISSLSRDEEQKIVHLNVNKVKDQELGFRSASLLLTQLFSLKKIGHVTPIITNAKNYEFLQQSFPKLLKLLSLLTIINVSPVDAAMIEYKNDDMEMTEIFMADLANAVHDLNEEELSDVEILEEEHVDEPQEENNLEDTVTGYDESDHSNSTDRIVENRRVKRDVDLEEDGYELVCEKTKAIEYVMRREKLTKNYDHIYYMESVRLNVGYFFNRISNVPLTLNLDPNTPPGEIQAGAFIDTLALARQKDYEGLVFKWMYFYWLYISSLLVEKNIDKKVRVVYIPRFKQIQVVYQN